MKPIQTLLGAALLVLPCYAGADTVRPAVGVPLQKAEALMQAQKYPAALQQVDKASAVAGLTPYETLVIAQVRGAAAAGAGDYATAASAYQYVIASGTQPKAAQTQMIQAVAGFYYQAQDYPHTIIWVNRYIAAQGQEPATRALLAQSYYQTGDYKAAEQAAWREQKAAVITGQKLPEAELQLLASAADKSGDKDGYQSALEALLQAYPAADYWNEAIGDITASPAFPDALTLDVYRLRFATGTLTAAGDYEDYAERAILAGQPAEAKKILARGFSSGALTDATDAGHAARLRTLADTKAAGAAPVSLNDATPSPIDAGAAAYQAGNTQNAIATFKKTPGYSEGITNSPTAALARLWVVCVENTTTQK
jgi:hypothetical protein